MAIKQFAIPLNNSSSKSGEVNFDQLAGAGMSADFEITHVAAPTSQNELNLVTRKNGVNKDHKFTPTFGNGSGKVALSAADLSTLFQDANGGDWDYVEAKWTFGQVDVSGTSNMYIHQNGRTYNYFGW